MDYQNDKLGMTKWKDGIKVYVGETLSGKLTFKNLTTMRNSYEGHYSYDKDVVGNWNATAMGVYYCGYIDGNNLIVHYVGRATSDEGIRGRLLQHLSEDKWQDVSHFGYSVCTTSREAEDFEASEILRLKPKYNMQGKSYGS
ncbi:MAG: hypothetical protein UR31_C0017G0003 [Parcubacteria group bacterium GW2011_GWA2_33_14]|nr:MAG: hypothetical protein UR31_C0017G0003 [Parcubacteria group bacterium GW2011_GWA2_33_14]OGZ70961.1 MAG: hypothetical protein A2980_03065 [Candidatus Staskawiczbacteria bacterium RIFCSPLOWO2_01_FULL_33_13]